MQKEKSGNKESLDFHQNAQKFKEAFLRELAGAAGFDIQLDRMKLIIPQLDWILDEANLIDSINLAGIEPFTSIIELWKKSEQER